MKKIKVLFLGTYPHPDNPLKGIFNYKAVSKLSKKVQIDIISIRMWKPGRKLVEKVINEGCTIFHLNIPHYPSTKLLIHFISAQIVTLFIRLILNKKLKKYDIIHSTGASTYGIYACILKNKIGAKHVMQLTGSDINSDIPLLGNNLIVNKIPGLVDVLTGNSARLIQEFNDFFNTTFPILNIYRGVDLEIFQFSNNSFEHKKGTIFLYLGGLNDYPNLPYKMNTKGGNTLMNSWKNVENKLSKLNARLFFGGPQSNRKEFLSWHSSLKFPKLVTLIGELNQNEVRKVYKKSNIIIIPSMEEGLPNVAVESAACGRASIASKVGGIPEIVDDNITGILFTKGEESELASAILQMAKNNEVVKKMGHNARKRVEQHFDQEKFSSAYIDVYTQMLN